MTPNPAHFSQATPVFHDLDTPEAGVIVGYAAIVDRLELNLPLPNKLAFVSEKNRSYSLNPWTVFPNRYQPEDHFQMERIHALYNHLVFALKYEGVNLLVFKKLIEVLTVNDLCFLVSIEPTGQYNRRIWFLLEWLRGENLPDIDDLTRKGYVDVIDTKIQYGVAGIKSSRHKVLNNLPGTPHFCPLIDVSPAFDELLTRYDSQPKIADKLGAVSSSILQRSTAFLLLKDSRASFSIEGESPADQKLSRWAKVIGKAGQQNLSKELILSLQSQVLEGDRFVQMGYRTKGGFIGQHDRITMAPLPDHISARWEDITSLMEGIYLLANQLDKGEYHPLLIATCVSFGFVFIHPLEDGNGRIHRYLVHHILAQRKLTPAGMVFPISAAMLDNIDDYRRCLEVFSKPLLDFIEWRETADHNVDVSNDTADYYRYFDATPQAEFLLGCFERTMKEIIPKEIAYLQNFDKFKRFIDSKFDMPTRLVSLLTRFLEQNEGRLSQRALKKEFSALSEDEVSLIELEYERVFLG